MIPNEGDTMRRAILIALGLTAAFAAAVPAAEPLQPCASGAESDGVPVSSERRHIPAIGEDAEVTVGQSLIREETHGVYPYSVEIFDDLTFVGKLEGARGLTLLVPKGVYTQPLTSTYGDSYAIPDGRIIKTRSPGREYPGTVSLSVSRTEGAPVTAYLKYNNRRGSVSMPARYKVSYCQALAAPSVTRQLIYTGVAANIVSFQYRETSRVAGVAPTIQELRYDLNHGSEIGYQGLRIQIVKAANATIRYRVLSPLD